MRSEKRDINCSRKKFHFEVPINKLTFTFQLIQFTINVIQSKLNSWDCYVFQGINTTVSNYFLL